MIIINIKKFFIIILIIFLFFSLSGCIKSYEDLIPDQKEFGSWDGNYVYHGNKRTKTTGEDLEVLVKEIEYGGITYEFVMLRHFTFHNDEIYMIAYMKSKLNISEEEYDSCMLIHYPIKTKKASVKYFSNNQDEFLSSFYHVTKDYLIISMANYIQNGLIKYNIQNDDYQEISGVDKFVIVEDYLIITEGSKVKYTKIDNIEFETIEGVNPNSYFNMVTIDGKKLLRILYSVHISPYNLIGNLEYFDFETKSLFTAWKYEDNKNVHLIGDNYFMVGETKGYNYVSSIRDNATKKYEVLTSYLSVNNVLYKIEYKNNIFAIEKVYEFEDDVSYEEGSILDDGKIMLTKTWIKKGTQLSPGGEKKEDVVFDPISKSLNKYKKPNTTISIDPLDKGIETDDYIYYVKTISYGPFIGRYFAYYFNRYDKKSKDRKVMQFFADERSEIKGTRYAVDFWDLEYFSFNNKNYLILNY